MSPSVSLAGLPLEHKHSLSSVDVADDSTQGASAGRLSPVSSWLDRDRTAIRLGHSIAATAVRYFDRHAHLYFEGEAKQHIYIVIEGVVGIYRVLADGRRQIMRFAYPGEGVGLDLSSRHDDSAEALSPVAVRSIPIAAIEKLLHMESDFAVALLRVAAADLADTREQLITLGRRSAAERLAGFLLHIAARTARSEGGKRNSVHLPMRRCDIGDYLGLTIETVSRCLTRFRVARLVHLESNWEVRILDPERLTAIANGIDEAPMK